MVKYVYNQYSYCSAKIETIKSTEGWPTIRIPEANKKYKA